MRRACISGVLIKMIADICKESARPFPATLLGTDIAGEGHSGQNHSGRVLVIAGEVIE
jgi:hypothetical protein